MSLLDLLQYRRSVRYYDPDKPLDSEKVRHCLQQGHFVAKQFQYATLRVLSHH